MLLSVIKGCWWHIILFLLMVMLCFHGNHAFIFCGWLASVKQSTLILTLMDRLDNPNQTEREGEREGIR